MDVLKRHRGAAAAILAPDLAAVFGHADDRQVRNCISGLRARGALIGSSTGKPGGYFVADTPDEVKAVVSSFRSRALSMLKTLSVLNRSARIRFGGQRVLPLVAVDEAIRELETQAQLDEEGSNGKV